MNNFYNSKNAKQQSVISQESGLFLHAPGWTLGVICFGFPHVTCHQVALGQFGHNPTSIQLQNMLKLTPASDIKWVRMSYWSTSEPLLGAFYVKTKPSGKLPQETRGHEHPTFKKPGNTRATTSPGLSLRKVSGAISQPETNSQV